MGLVCNVILRSTVVAPAPGLLEVLAYFLGILAAGFKLSRRDVEDRIEMIRKQTRSVCLRAI
jgi:hypothetical protein